MSGHKKILLRIILTIVALVTTELNLVSYDATKTLTAATVIACVGLLGIAMVALRTYATRGCNERPLDEPGSEVTTAPSTSERRAA